MGIRDGQTDNGNGNGALIDPYTLSNNYGVLAYDHKHVFNAAYVWNLPSPIKGNAFLKGAVNGWQLSGVTQLQSGAPIQPNTSGTLNVVWPTGVGQNQILGTNAETLVPAPTCDPRSNLRSGQYFNPGCFTTPSVGSNGSVVGLYIKGPAYFNSDLALFKNFKFSESKSLQLRFSAFNFLNHPLKQFNADGTNQDPKLTFNAAGKNTNGSTTGSPIYSVGNRLVELTAKLYF